MNTRMIVQEHEGTTPEIAAIIHDLRNPLSTIFGSAELLIASRLSEQHLHRVARNLYGASVRIEELLEEFLGRYKGTEARRQCCELSALIDRAVDRIALIAESQSVQIFRNVPEELLMVLDPKRIQRVLVNLFVNALDVMPNGGTILVSAIPQGHSILIKVRDTGPGIAPEISDRLFEPFVTAGKAKGLGLGLAFSRQAVLDHGGEMWVEASSHGACFVFRLPVIQ